MSDRTKLQNMTNLFIHYSVKQYKELRGIKTYLNRIKLTIRQKILYTLFESTRWSLHQWSQLIDVFCSNLGAIFNLRKCQHWFDLTVINNITNNYLDSNATSNWVVVAKVLKRIFQMMFHYYAVYQNKY